MLAWLMGAALAVQPIGYTKDDSIYQVGNAFVRESAVRLCTRQYPADLSMRKVCIDMNVEGSQKFFGVRNRAAGRADLVAALTKCLRDYTDDAGYRDWMMIGTCAEMQEEAADKLGL